MCGRIIVLLFLVLPSLVLGRAFSDVARSDDRTKLVIMSEDGLRSSAPPLYDQVEFDRPLVSPNGSYVGWLALFPNCCTSYPVPMMLVVMDEKRRLQTFTGTQAIFSWCFLPDSGSVAYMQAALHFSNEKHFERRSLRDGRLISQYNYPHEDAANKRAREGAPAWVRCVPE